MGERNAVDLRLEEAIPEAPLLGQHTGGRGKAFGAPRPRIGESTARSRGVGGKKNDQLRAFSSFFRSNAATGSN